MSDSIFYLTIFPIISLYSNFDQIVTKEFSIFILDVVTLSGILKAKQKLGVTFNFDKQDVIDFTKFSKMTMCRASEANSEK